MRRTLLCTNCEQERHSLCLGDPCGCECIGQRARDRERTRRGMRRAGRSGRRMGRPSLEIDGNDILKLHAQGFSLREIAHTVGASKSWIQAFLKKRGRKCR